ncbi:hypothetical protein J6590_003918 [Homalodisca vitripennis]|nr:hypothetical protein J6590_003918 [Homalodisca vitripennis]
MDDEERRLLQLMQSVEREEIEEARVADAERERLQRQLFPDVEQLNTIETIYENPIEREGSEQSEDEEHYSEHDTNSEVSLDDLADHEEDFNVQGHECHDCLCYYGKGSSNCVANQNQPVQWSKKISVKLEEGVFFVQEPKTERVARGALNVNASSAGNTHPLLVLHVPLQKGMSVIQTMMSEESKKFERKIVYRSRDWDSSVQLQRLRAIQPPWLRYKVAMTWVNFQLNIRILDSDLTALVEIIHMHVKSPVKLEKPVRKVSYDQRFIVIGFIRFYPLQFFFNNFHSRNEQNYDSDGSVDIIQRVVDDSSSDNSSACSESDDEANVIEVPTLSITTTVKPTLIPKSRINAWKDITIPELKTFLGVLLHTGTKIRYYRRWCRAYLEGCPTPFEGLFGARLFSVYGLSMKQVKCDKRVITRKSLVDIKKVTKKNQYGETKLHILCQRRNSSIAEIQSALAMPETDVNAKDNNGYTPLHKAVIYASVLKTKLLLQHQILLGKSAVDIGAQNKAGSTPLHEAVRVKSLELCKLLVDHGEDDIENLGNVLMEPLYSNPREVTVSKKKDMMDLLPYIPPIHHGFFMNLVTASQCDENPVIDSE